MTPTRVKKGFVEIGGRKAHLRISGRGPPIVMLHGSPGDGEMLAAEMGALSAAGFTCIALDTPGFGGSDALAGDRLRVRDLAAATAEAMVALGLPPCRVYGTHTGAAIAAELGVGWPAQVTGLLLEGLPLFTPQEVESLFGSHFAPMTLDPLGGHLFATWMRFRDQFTWFPWAARRPEALNPVTRPAAGDVDLWVSMFYRSYRTYGPAYRAACAWGPLGLAVVEALDRSAIFMATAEDMLFPHLDRLPPLRADQRIVRLDHDPKARLHAIGALARALAGPDPAGADAPIVRGEGLVGGDLQVGYVSTSAGQVFVRAWGDPTASAVMYLHDAFGTGRSLSPLASRLATGRRLIAPDLPGSGQSDDPPEAADRLEVTTAALGETVDRLAGGDIEIAAQGSSCTLGASVAARAGARSLVLHEALPPGRVAAAAFAPELPLSDDGGHWQKAWMMIRDAEVYIPWCDGRVEAQRRTQGEFDAAFLHEETVALMRSRATYHLTPRLLLGVSADSPSSMTVRRTAGPGREALFQALAAPQPGVSP